MARRNQPVTRHDLSSVLDDLDIRPGTVVLAHAALSRLGWIVGGTQSVLSVLLDQLSSDGTLVMPGFSSQLSDPAEWTAPPIPEGWVNAVRAAMPIFDKEMTPTHGIGRLPETFRAMTDTLRSGHPIDSFLANGVQADVICAAQPVDQGLGQSGSLGHLVRLDADVLFLGTDWETCTAFHLADYRDNALWETVRFPQKISAGQTRWHIVRDVNHDIDDFPAIGAAFERTGMVRRSLRLAAPCRAFRIRDAVRFAKDWHGFNP